MNLLESLMLILFSIIEIRKSVLVLRKNQMQVFLGVQIVLFIMKIFQFKKRIDVFNKEYKKKIRSYAIQSIIVWAFVFMFNLVRLWLAIIRKELF